MPGIFLDFVLPFIVNVLPDPVCPKAKIEIFILSKAEKMRGFTL